MKQKTRRQPSAKRSTQPQAHPTPRASSRSSAERRTLIIIAGVAVATVAVYARVLAHQFINLDDDIYVYLNPMVTGGLTAKGIAWAFTSFHAANWHPLTWISHMVDVQVFGLAPGAHLAVNLAFHILNSILLFLVFLRLTGRSWCSALVAALFAMHPMHVESVAWVAERKDVLSTFFAFLSLLAYVRFARAEKPARKKLLPVIAFFALGLLAKPMLVTLPFVMLLLDYWPLKRVDLQMSGGFKAALSSLRPLVVEKLPLFLLVIGSIAVTYVAQSRAGAVRQFADEPLTSRLSNAVVSYAKYLITLFWPTDLGVYYPFPPNGTKLWQPLGALILVACITIFVQREISRRRYLIVGWLWFLGTLIPVLGLVQVGGQSMADRYSYLPFVGIFIMIVWGVADLVERGRLPWKPVVAAAIVWVAALGTLTWIQVGYWRDSVTLFRHTLLVAPNNLVIHYNLGHALGQQGHHDEAIAEFAETLKINPDFFDALINIGISLNGLRRFDEASRYLTKAVEIQPNSSKAQMQLGMTLAQTGNSNDSLPHFYRALELAPNDPDVRVNLGLMLTRAGKLNEAAEQLNEAVRLNPNSPEAQNNLGLVLLMRGDAAQSIAHFSNAFRLRPDFKLAQDNLNRAQSQLKNQQ